MPKKISTPTFILELPLVVGSKERLRLEKAFEIGRKIYNATLATALARLKRMREDPAWKKAVAMPKGKERNSEFSRLQKKFDLTLNGLRTIANNHRSRSKTTQIGAHEAQEIGKTVWQALEGYIFRKGGKPRFKSWKRGLNSISGTDNRELIWKPEESALYWRNKPYRAKIGDSDYVRRCLTDPVNPDQPRRVKYCRVVRRTIRGKEQWYVQLVLEGLAPVRHVTAPVADSVGIDPGPSHMAVYSERGAQIFELAPCVERFETEIRRIQRAMDRSRRRSNPENYNENGTVRAGKLQWKESKRYKKLRARLAEIRRCQEETRVRDHGYLCNIIFQLGGDIRVEKNSYLSFQRNFGRSTTHRAPGKFIEILQRKAASAGLKVTLLDAGKYKMSQYDFVTGNYVKKPLKQRWHRLGKSNVFVQRDIMSAFLACYAGENGHNPQLLCEKRPTMEALLCGAGLCRQIEVRSNENSGQPERNLTKEVKAVRLNSTDKHCTANLLRLGLCPSGVATPPSGASQG